VPDPVSRSATDAGASATAAPDTPVIVVTGRPADSFVYAAMAEGADEYLNKSEIDAGRLRDVITRATQRRRGTDRHRRALASAASVFDSIGTPIAVIDGSGRIVAVNDAWELTSAQAETSLTRTGVGVNYLAVCDQAAGRFAEGSAEMAAGIRSVLRGELGSFARDYPCPTPDGERWYTLRVSPSGEMGGGAVIIHLDITDLKAAERRVTADESRVLTAFDESTPIFALIDADATVVHVSDLTRTLLGLDPDERIGAHAFDLIEAGDRARAQETFARVATVPGARAHIQVRALDGAGRWRDLDLTVVNLLDDPRVGAIAITGNDATDARLHQIASRIENRILGRLPVSVVLTDHRGIVVYWNDSAEALFGLSAAEAVGRPVAELGIQPTDRAANAAIVRTVRRDGGWEGDMDASRADGSVVPIHIMLEHVIDEEIDFEGVVGAAIDITERRQLEADLEFQAFHDPLTELPNRRLFVERLDAVLDAHERDGNQVGVAFIDLDDFKAINDRIGHSVGDQALCIIAERLSSVLRAGDVVARIGGDEFVVGFAELSGPSEAERVAERLLETVRAPFSIGHQQLQMSATVGLALSQPGVSADGLLRNADAAMYAAKEIGKNRVELFDDVLAERTRQRRDFAERLIDAITDGDVHAQLQPQICLRTGALIGFEALARWRRDDEVFADNAGFIELAEEAGVVERIDGLVLAEACTALAAFHAMRPDAPPTISVNVSARQLAEPGFPAVVRDLVDAAGFPSHLLCLEVVESALADVDAAVAALEAINAIGVELAIDDFGTGYSSLSRLQQFHVDYLKIDRSFVAGMDDGDDDAAIVSAVIALAKALDLRTVAEGVETSEQAERLAQLGVDVGQGFLWSPAVPVDAATEMVAASTDRFRARPRR